MLKGFSRTIRYSTYMGTKTFLYALLATAIYSVYFQLAEGMGNLTLILSGLKTYLPLVTMMLTMILGMVGSVTSVPLQISFGAKRSYAAVSIACNGLVTSAESLALYIVYSAIVSNFGVSTDVSRIGTIVCLYICGIGITSLMSVLVMSFGRIAYSIAVITMCVFVGITSGILAADKGDYLAGILHGSVLMAVAAVAFIVGNGVLIAYSKKIVVKS